MTLIKIPVIGFLLLVIYFFLVGLTQQEATAIVSNPASRYASVGTTNFDPSDLCKSYDQAFRAAGVPNICTYIQNKSRTGSFGTLEIRNGNTGDLIAQIDYSKEPLVNYSKLLPKEVVNSGRPVWSTSLRVLDPFTGQGIGSSIVYHYEQLLRTLGAESGDYELVIASPSRSMPYEKQQAWMNFVAQYCAKLAGAIPLLGNGIGCYRVLP